MRVVQYRVPRYPATTLDNKFVWLARRMTGDLGSATRQLLYLFYSTALPEMPLRPNIILLQILTV